MCKQPLHCPSESSVLVTVILKAPPPPQKKTFLRLGVSAHMRERAPLSMILHQPLKVVSLWTEHFNTLTLLSIYVAPK